MFNLVKIIQKYSIPGNPELLLLKELFKQYICPILIQHRDALENVENWKDLVMPIFNPSDNPYQRKRKLSSMVDLVLSCKNKQLSDSSKKALIYHLYAPIR